jgi:hypothetical protein
MKYSLAYIKITFFLMSLPVCASAQASASPNETNCSGFYCIPWANHGWLPNEFVKIMDLTHGLTMTTTIDDPANILLPMYPKLYEGLPALFISSNSPSKSISWTSEFNQPIGGCHFSLYETEQSEAEVKGYKGLTEVQPILSKATQIVDKKYTNIPLSTSRKINVLFTQSIDKFVITYKKNKNSLYAKGAILLVGDITLFCSEPSVAPELRKKVTLAKIAPMGKVHTGDIISYLFQFHNREEMPQMVSLSDVLPDNFYWCSQSFIGNLKGEVNNYAGNRTFNMDKILLPTGLSVFTLDAYVGATAGEYAHQSLFYVQKKSQLSDDPTRKGIMGISNQTQIAVVAPKGIAPLSVVKTVSATSALNTDMLIFTYIFQNAGVKMISADFRDEIQPDTAYYKTSSLVFEGGIMGVENLYSQSNSLYINDLHIPVGKSSITIQVALNGCANGFYKNAATITPLESSGFRAIEMPSNEALWAVVSKNDLEFVADCKSVKVENHFIANELNNQLGHIQLKINVLKAGETTFKINGVGMTGSLTTILDANTSIVKIPIRYDGSGSEGLRTVTIASELGSKVCAVNAFVEPAVQTEVARVKGRSK